MAALFQDMMTGLDEVNAFLVGHGKDYKVTVPDEVDVKGIRKKLSMTQARFSNTFGFSLDAVKHWEGGRRTPESSTRVFLTVIARNPDAVIEALHRPAKPVAIPMKRERSSPSKIAKNRRKTVAKAARASCMTVTEIFDCCSLTASGPVPWGTDIPATSAGVYVIARVGDAKDCCIASDLQFKDLRGIELDLEYERRRWLPKEPIVYVGKTDRAIRERVRQFRHHRCGNPSPHAGGQVVKLLRTDLWIYWSPTDNPFDAESKMISAFEKHAGQAPFANKCRERRQRRIRRSNRPATLDER